MNLELENRILFAESRLIVYLVSKFFSIRRLICSSFCMVSLKILFWMIAFFSIKDTVFARLNFVNSCFFFLFWLYFRLFPLFRWFFYDWRILKTFSSSFCWNLSQLSTRIVSTCGFCSVSVSFLISILFSGLSLFYVVSLSSKANIFIYCIFNQFAW